MNRLLFLAVNRYSVEYTVAAGRPFSELDRLVLRAIIESNLPTIDQLKEMFQLPQRPLLENLVTLFHAGWVAMNSQGRFLATPEGHRALDLRTLPVSMRILTPRPLTILMETLTGMCVGVRDGLRYDSRQNLRDAGLWDHGRRIAPLVTRTLPDEGIVRSLLRPRRREWIHSIKEPVPRGQNAAFLRVLVDPESREIVGLPERWLPALTDFLVEEAKLAPPPRDAAPFERPVFTGGRFPESPHKIVLQEDDLITTPEEHQSVLRNALLTVPANSWIGIAGDSIDPVWLMNEWGEALAQALVRGVNVDLLWRTIERTAVDETAEAQLARCLAVINEAAAGSDARGILRANPSPSRSRMRYLFVAPPEPKPAEAWIGGWEWLTPVGDAPSGASVRLREPGLLSELALATAALFDSATSQTLSTLPEQWRELAERLDRQQFYSVVNEEDGQGNCEVRFLRDREIDRTIADHLSKAERIRIRTCSRDVKGPLLRRLRDRMRGGVLWATIQTSTALADGKEWFGQGWSVHGGNIAETIIADDTLIVSSVPMSGSGEQDAGLADLGLAILGGPVVAKLGRLWADEPATSQEPAG